MNIRQPKYGMGRVMLILISLVSVLSISATYFLASQTLYLPLVFSQDSALSPTATLSLTPTITPTPKPPATLQLMVTPSNPDKDWAVAFFAKSYNDAGRPVMQIYPGDNSLESLRIKIPRGTIVLALDTPVIADGGGKYWQLVDYKGRADEDLFLKAADVTKVTPSEPGN